MRKISLITTLLVVFGILFTSNFAFAQDYTSEEEMEFNYGVGAGYFTFIDGDNSGPYVSLYSLNEKWMAEIGYGPSDGEIGGEEEDNMYFIDINAIFRFGMDEAEPGTSTWFGLGGEWLNGQYGVNGQFGYEKDNWLFRIKMGWLTEDAKPLFFGVGYSF